MLRHRDTIPPEPSRAQVDCLQPNAAADVICGSPAMIVVGIQSSELGSH